jgi:uncharacterized protein (DUF1697 family)
MVRYAALLRGINVGGKAKLPMTDLRELLAGLGFAEVRTHLQSGNAVFSTSRARPEQCARRIEEAISRDLGLQIRCLVRTGDELGEVIAENPFREVATDGSKMMALFLSEQPEPAVLAEHDPVALAPDEVRVGDRVVYQWCPDGLRNAPAVSGFLEKRWKVAVTARNWNTVTKLHEMLR